MNGGSEFIRGGKRVGGGREGERRVGLKEGEREREGKITDLQ